MRPVKSPSDSKPATIPTSPLRKAFMLPLCVALAAAPAYAGIPTITDLSDLTVSVGAPATIIAPNISFSGGDSYTDGSITFSLASATTSDTLSILSESNPNAEGAISVTGSDIYLGNGSGRDRVGSIDPIQNGEAGADLKILFSSPLENSSFEDGTSAGWTEFAVAYPNEADLDGDTINLAGGGTATINIADSSTMTYDINVVTSPVSSGTYALQLSSSGIVTCSDGAPGNYCSVHGPYLESSSFEAFNGDQIYLDWSAQNGGDWYEVLGYLLGDGADNTFGTGDDTETLLFSERGDTKEFSTETATISATDTYRFRFVSGSYDASGGTALGASLYVDNVRVVSGVATTDAVALNIARRVAFQNTDDNPETSRELTVTLLTEDASTDTASANIIINLNDAPTITSNGGGASAAISVDENQTAVTTVTATDENGDDISFSISGGADADAFSINAASGVLTFITAPDAQVKDSYTVIVSASDGVATDEQTLNITVNDISELVTSRNSGGSTTFGLLSALALLALRRLKIGVKGVAMLFATTSFAAVSTPTHAEQSLLDKLSVTLQGMHVNAEEANDRFSYQITEAGVGDNLKSGDDQHEGWGISANYLIDDKWQVTAGYVDLGDADTSLVSDTATIDEFLSTTDNLRMQTGSGVTLGAGYVSDLGNDWSASANVGIFAWDADIDFDSTSGNRKVSESDQDLFFGAGIAKRVIPALSVGFGWQRYRLDASDLDAFMLTATYHVGAGLN